MLRGELKEAELECQKALPLREGLLEKHPDVLRYKVDLARCQNDVAYFLAEQGKEFQAEATYNKALTHFRELVRVNPYLPEFKSSLAETLNDMGLLCMKKNTRIAQAEKFFLEALGIREWLSQNHSNVGYYVVDLGATHANLGHLHMDKSDFPEAQKELGKGIEILQACLASEPRQPRARRFLRKAHSDRARLYDRLGEYIAAIHDWDHALEVDDGPGKAEIRAFKALSLARAGDLTAAEAEANEVASHTSDVEILVTAARVYGVMSGMSGTSSAKAEPHAVKAVALLQRAIQAGYKNLSVLRRDSDLDSLRKRDDFRKVLSSLESMK
jgi:tetratricopeptide (TPR) repeat protein